MKKNVPVITDCIYCGECCNCCLENAIICEGGKYVINPTLCTGCGFCEDVCPVGGIVIS